MGEIIEKAKWRNVSAVSFLLFLVSFMYTLKTYQVLGAEMFNTTNGFVFLIGTLIFATITIVALRQSFKRTIKC